MKFIIFFVSTILTQTLCLGQKLNKGSYTFTYCDLEYNMCIGTCKIIIKGDSIAVYATKELSEKLTHVKEGDIIEKGIIVKHKSGKWILGASPKDKNINKIGIDGPAILDFKKKQYWTF